MTVVWIVLGSLATLVAVALSQWLTVRGRIGREGVVLDIRYLWIRIEIPSGRTTAQKQQAESEIDATKADVDDSESKGRSGGNVREWLKLVPEGLQAVVASWRYLLRRTRIERLRVTGTVGSDDPSETGMAVGAIHALHGALGPWGRAIELAVVPDFETDQSAIVAEGTVHVRAGTLLATPLVGLWHLPKRKVWRAWRAGRRHKGSSRNAGRRTADLA